MSTSRFRDQIDHLARERNITSIDKIFAHVLDGAPLPANSCLLTFDDGLLDHRWNVLPALAERDLPATFFVSAATVDSREVLDVHKIQSILATGPCMNDVLEVINIAATTSLGSERWEYVRRRLISLANTNRFDSKGTALAKIFLQRGPEPARSHAIDVLFDRHVPMSASALAAELYLSRSDLQVLVASGMSIGGHGLGHPWLSTQEWEEQRQEVLASRDLLADLFGETPQRWAFAYPFGDYDATTLALLEEHGCTLGFTTSPEVSLQIDRPLRIPRLDCNDFMPTSPEFA
jgi:peptidoglycan/xylan/chitin deacetylase (PgdA/CDA1 family)